MKLLNFRVKKCISYKDKQISKAPIKFNSINNMSNNMFCQKVLSNNYIKKLFGLYHSF